MHTNFEVIHSLSQILKSNNKRLFSYFVIIKNLQRFGNKQQFCLQNDAMEVHKNDDIKMLNKD